MSLTPEFVRFRIAMLLVAALLAVTGLVLATASSATAGGGGVGTGTTSSGDRDSGRDKYAKIWDRISDRNKRWANRTARCESGKDPNAIGGGGQFRGAFQFMKSTWRSSPKSPGGDPIDYNYKTQAVVAVKLKQRDGAGHWPNCG